MENSWSFDQHNLEFILKTVKRHMLERPVPVIVIILEIYTFPCIVSTINKPGYQRKPGKVRKSGKLGKPKKNSS